MNSHWLNQPWIESLGWTLLHSVWQLSLLAAIAMIALLLLRRSSSQIRYTVAYLFLLAMMAVPVATFAYEWQHRPLQPIDSETTTFTQDQLPAPRVITTHAFSPLLMHAQPASISQTLVQILHVLTPYTAIAYLLCAFILTLRLLVGYIALRKVCTDALPAATREVLLHQLCQRLHLSRPVRLLQSHHVEVPTVIGAFRPLILLPLTAMTGLSADHLTLLLLHELAHIRRHDYLANLIQSIAETLLFYHPAMIWLSGQVRQEREHCCDDLAIAAAGNRGGYAAALASMESLRAEPTNLPRHLVLGARDGSLLQRIHRVLQIPAPGSIRQRIITGSSLTAAAMALIVFSLYLAACSRNDSPPTASATAPAVSDATVVTATTSAPSPNRTAQAGDILKITIYELFAASSNYTDDISVNEDGNVHLVYIGDVPVIGKTPRQIEDAIIRAAVDGNPMHDPQVRVTYTNEHADFRPLQSGDQVMSKIFEIQRPGEFANDVAFVDEKGDLRVIYLGRVHVQGLTPAQAGARISAAFVDKQLMSMPVDVQVSRLSSDTLEIAIESRIMFVEDGSLAWLKMPNAPAGTLATRLLTDAELTEVLQDLIANANTVSARSPRMVLFNGQSGEIQVSRGNLDDGIRFTVNSTASGDRQRVTANLALSLNQAGASPQKISAHVVVPESNTLLVAGLTASDDKATSRHLIALIRQKIITEKETENTLYGPGYHAGP